MKATEADVPEIIAFLNKAPHRAMFPLANLINDGIGADGPYGTHCYLVRDAAGEITDLIALSNEGNAMPCCPTGPKPELLAGKKVKGVLAPTDEARPLIDALGLNGPTLVSRDEPHFLLDLDKVIIPDGDTHVVHISEAPSEVADWFPLYMQEVLGRDPVDAMEEGRQDYLKALSGRDYIVLMDGETPVAMANLNARLTDIVQVGGVFTPHAYRGRGYAKRVTALLMERARNEGVRQGTLFAANESAARAYKAIGFERIGDFTLFIMKEPQIV